MTNRIQRIGALGQAVWLDYISRELLKSGELEKLVAEGVTGVTSNPTIFQKAVAAGHAYDEQLASLTRAGKSAEQIYEELVLADISEAADILRSVYDRTDGRDGFVSIEVAPKLAHDTDGTLAEARRLFEHLNRPNVMIKVPATDAGVPAVRTLIGEGVNVNVTLIFSLAMYEKVMRAYLDGLDTLRKSGRPLSGVASVASFFISRVDTLVDDMLGARIAEGARQLEPLLGQAANANAKLAYSLFQQHFVGEPFADLLEAGARPQRPLWASTSAKNPAYPDTKYVDPLIGPNTVNTLPPATLDALRDHGVAAQTIEQNVDEARRVMAALREGGIDMEAVTDRLLTEGVRAFADSFDKLLADVAAKRAANLTTA